MEVWITELVLFNSKGKIAARVIQSHSSHEEALGYFKTEAVGRLINGHQYNEYAIWNMMERNESMH